MCLTRFLFAALLIGSLTAQAQIQNKPSTHSQQETASFSRKTSLPKWAQNLAEIPATQSKEPVVIRLNETQAWAGSNPSYLINRAVQVNEQSALGAIGQLGITYYPAYQKLTLHKVAIIRNGQVMDRTLMVNTRQLQRETSMEAGMLGGAATVQLLLDDVRVGDTLWITYSVEGENPVFGKRWASDFYWENASLTELRRVVVLHPKNRPLFWRQIGDFQKDQIKPQIDTIGEIERISFEGKAIEALDNEPSIPQNYLPVRVLQFSEYNSWQEVAIWANGLFPKAGKSPELKKLAKSFSGDGDPVTQASAALHWVQNEVRYFSVSIGENSHRPQAPDTVLKRRYGDCKDKSYLLVSLLTELGIEARPVLLSAQAPKVPQKMLPSPAMFDHVIVEIKIADKTYYVDPTRTHQTASIDKIQPPFSEASALIVDAATKELTILPAKPETFVQYEHRENIEILNFDGDAVLELRDVYFGNYAEWARQRFLSLSKSEIRKIMLGQYEKLYPQIVLDKAPDFQDFPENNRFEVKARFKLQKVLSQKDGKFSIDYDTQIIYDTLGIPEKITRNYPFELPTNKFHGRYYLNVTWPTNVRVKMESTAKRLDNPFFQLYEELSAAGNLYQFITDYQVKVKEVPASEMSAFQRSAKELANFTNGSLSVFENGISKSESGGLSIIELEALSILKENKTVLENFDKNDPDVSKYCEAFLSSIPVSELLGVETDRTAAELEGILSPAKHLKKGLKLCQAKYLFLTGQYHQSLPLFEADQPLDDTNKDLLDLAYARLVTGDSEGAISTVARFYKARLKSEENALTTQELSRIVSLYQRAGKQIPAEIFTFGAEMPDGPWPRPVLAYQLGIKTREQLLEDIKQYSADTQAIYLSDFYFFVAQKSIANGEMQEAISAMKWYKKNGLRQLPDFMLIHEQLKELAPTEVNIAKGKYAQYRGQQKLMIEKWHQSAAAGNPEGNYQLGKEYYYGDSGEISRDYQKAMLYFKLAADAGVAEAMNFIGILYDNGEGVSVNKALAFEWYKKAAENNNRHGYYNIAEVYRAGSFVPRDLKKAFDNYKLAAELGHAGAQAVLARFYLEGKGTEVDFKQAYRWAILASTQANSEGMVLLGRIYADGSGVEKDEKIAMRFFQISAGMKNKNAYYRIGQFYEYGSGVEEDMKIAAQWYTQAAKLGHEDAMAILGGMYLEGKGVNKNISEALALIQAAVERNSAIGQLQLAYMYKNGIAVKQDRAMSSKLYRLAAEQGFTYAQRELAMNLHFGYGVAKNTSEAAIWYEKAASKGDAFSKNNLGDLYENGDGVNQDIPKAIGLYEEIAGNASYMGFISLAHLYNNGIGVEKNLYLAYIYNKIAERLNNSIAKRSTEFEKSLTSDEIEKANKIAKEWKKEMPLPK